MSQVLYRKYRPKFFNEIIGQEHIRETLKNQISTGKIVHSYLFSGSRGIGKTTIARLLAKALNCLERKEKENEPCNKCANCQALNLGNALSIIEIDAASHTGVDNVRDKIIENVRFAPTGAKYKIFIIDEAHMLSKSAFNALLKTLEEPPEYAVFILATTEHHKIPATILSRCQRFDFKRPGISEIKQRLKKLAKNENIEVEDKVLERIGVLADGAMRDAEGLFGQLLGLGFEKITEKDADLVLPKNDFSLAMDFLENLVKKQGQQAMLTASGLEEKGLDLKFFIGSVIELGRKLLFSKITGEEDVGLTDDANKKLKALKDVAQKDEIIKILDILLQRSALINTLSIPSLPLELAVAEICAEDHESTKLQEHESKPAITAPIKPKTGTMPGNLKEINDKWNQVLEKIKDYNHSLPFILTTAEIRGFDEGNLFLATKFKLHKDKLDDPKNKAILTNVLKSVYNNEIQIQAEVDEKIQIVNQAEEEIDVESEFKTE